MIQHVDGRSGIVTSRKVATLKEAKARFRESKGARKGAAMPNLPGAHFEILVDGTAFVPRHEDRRDGGRNVP
jgi:hypothetical protein